MERTLLSIGSINADFQMRIDAHPGLHHMQQAREFQRFPGGKAGNTAYLAAHFGLHSRLLGQVGNDDLAEQALAPLRRAGVDISGVSRVDGRATGVSIVMVPPDAKKYIVLATNANDDWDELAAKSVVDAISNAARPACLAVDCEIPAVIVRGAVECAWENDIPIVLDPSFPERIGHDLLAKLTAITPNVDEAEVLLGRPLDTSNKIADGLRYFCDEGVQLACIKLAQGGCMLMSDEQVIHLPPGDVPVVDTTGAGDAFTGVLAIALLEGREPVEAAAWAVAAANLAVKAYGSQAAYAGREQVQSMANELLRRAQRVHG